jgi:hypothetical protein
MSIDMLDARTVCINLGQKLQEYSMLCSLEVRVEEGFHFLHNLPHAKSLSQVLTFESKLNSPAGEKLDVFNLM